MHFGNVVFIQKDAGHAKTELRKRLSDALEILGIQRYILDIDAYVQEFLGKKSETASGSVAYKRSSARFPILEPLTCSAWRKFHRPRSRGHSDETEVTHQVLHAFAYKIHERCSCEPWVLLVQCSFPPTVDHIRLQQLSDKFNFVIHMLPVTSKRDLNSRFQSIVAKILAAQQSINSKPRNDKRGSKWAERQDSLHGNSGEFKLTSSDNQSKCSIGSALEVNLASYQNAENDGKSSASFTSFPESSVDDPMTRSEIDLEDDVLEAGLDLSKRLPAPDLQRYLKIAQKNGSNNVRQSHPVVVVLVRDAFQGRASQLSLLLKKTLKRKRIQCQRLVVSTLFLQSKSIELMKHFGSARGSADVKTKLSRGCLSLVLNILHFKLSEQYIEPVVIVLDLEDERYVRLFKILDFCHVIRQSVLVLEKSGNGSFEQNFKKVISELEKKCTGHGNTKRIHRLMLPQFNLTFVKEFLPYDSSIKFFLEGETQATGNGDSSDCSHGPALDCDSSLIHKKISAVEAEQSSDSPPVSVTGRVGQQIIRFIFTRKKSLESVTPTSESLPSLSRTQVGPRLRGSFGIESLRSIFRRRRKSERVPEVVSKLQIEAAQIPGCLILHAKEKTGSTSRLDAVADTVIADSIHDEPDVPSKNGDSVSIESLDAVLEKGEAGFDENMNELTNPTFANKEISACRKVHDGSDIESESAPKMHLNNSEKIACDEALPAEVQGQCPRCSSAAKMWQEIEDYVPDRTRPNVPTETEQTYRRISLIQICRLPPRKRRRIEVGNTSSDDSLFKAWIAFPRNVPQPKPGIISRFMTSAHRGCYAFILGPLRNAFRKSNRITPSQLIRRDWTKPLYCPENQIRRRRPLSNHPCHTSFWVTSVVENQRNAAIRKSRRRKR